MHKNFPHRAPKVSTLSGHQSNKKLHTHKKFIPHLSPTYPLRVSNAREKEMRVLNEQLVHQVEKLILLPKERQWFEFKENWYEPVQLGEYISALANSAAFEDEPYAYFVWGINDDTHEVVGTAFDFRQDYQKSPLETFLASDLNPGVNFRFEEVELQGKRVVVLKIPKAERFIVSFKGKRFIRIGSSKADLSRYPEREMALMEIIKNGYPTLDNTPSQYQDLTFSQIFGYFAGKGITLKQSNFKKNLGLLTKDGEYNLLA